MHAKKNASPAVLVERAVIVACANARLPGWRQAQMKVFANRLGNYPIPEECVDLERECTRIVRSAGYRYARKLLNWLISVKHDEDGKASTTDFPRGIPKQTGQPRREQIVQLPETKAAYRYKSRSTPVEQGQYQQRLM